MNDSNIIYVGNKPTINYVLAVMRAFTYLDVDNVVLKARGRAISKAVDVTEILRKRLLANQVDIKDIKIDTEILGEDMRNVSTIEIVLEKKA